MNTTAQIAAALAGRYLIERELGEGGMATVLLAKDLKNDRLVAIKVLKPELSSAIGAERFLSEIRMTAQLSHPRILPLLDSGNGKGLLYFVMPYFEGETLRHRMDREKQFRIDDALDITCQVADALSYAHSRGIIHRDIKPENILLADGHAVVADFGVARAVTTAGDARITETGVAVGTPTYMSPEQSAADRQLDARTDVYSLACVTYEMLVGQPPFVARNAQALIARRLTETPRPVSATRHTIDPAIDAAILKALALAPKDRYKSAKQFAAALGGEAPAASMRRRTQVVLAIVLAIILVAVLVVFVSRPVR